MSPACLSVLIDNYGCQCNQNYVICFLLGDSPASDAYIPTFQNTLFYFHRLEDGTERSETLEYKLQTPVNHPEESIQHPEHGESLKSRTTKINLPTDVNIRVNGWVVSIPALHLEEEGLETLLIPPRK
jgi:hypothetical protein